jgi:hypothetical protein
MKINKKLLVQINGIGGVGKSTKSTLHINKRCDNDKKILFTIKELKDEKENNDEN